MCVCARAREVSLPGCMGPKIKTNKSGPMMRTSCRCERGRGAGGPGLDQLRNKTRFYRAKIGFYSLKPKTLFSNGKRWGFFQPWSFASFACLDFGPCP